MSHFLFGTVNQGSERFDYNDSLGKLNALANKFSLHIYAGSAIPQERITEMLKEQGLLSSEYSIPFLLVSSSGEDTSDALISPYYFGKDWLRNVSKHMANIMCFFQALLQNSSTASIDVLFTEGYDIAFKQLKIQVQELEVTIMSEIKRNIEVPSIHVKIT